MNNKLNLTHEQMAICKDVEKGSKSSPKNVIIKSVLKDLSKARDEIERLLAVMKWISVNGELPGSEIDVLVWCRGDFPNLAWRRLETGEWHTTIGGRKVTVTHWMKIEPPEEK